MYLFLQQIILFLKSRINTLYFADPFRHRLLKFFARYAPFVNFFLHFPFPHDCIDNFLNRIILIMSLTNWWSMWRLLIMRNFLLQLLLLKDIFHVVSEIYVVFSFVLAWVQDVGFGRMWAIRRITLNELVFVFFWSPTLWHNCYYLLFLNTFKW